MNKMIIIVLVVLAAVGAGAFFLFGMKKNQASVEESVPVKNAVTIEGFALNPKTITVKKGESVSWTNKDLVGHSATADDNSWDTGIIVNGKSASITFAKAGTYTYHCTPHPQIKGTVIVTE